LAIGAVSESGRIHLQREHAAHSLFLADLETVIDYSPELLVGGAFPLTCCRFMIYEL
jgi:hypothetical protein